MISYQVDGKILILNVVGDVIPEERQRVYDAIRADPAVLDGSVLIVDARFSRVTFLDATLEARVRLLLDQLGPKVREVCAFIEPEYDPVFGLKFQRACASLGVQVGLFANEARAREWLAPFLGKSA